MILRICIILLCLIGFPCISVAQDTRENADFKLAVNLYNDKLYDLALEQFQQFINRYPNSQQAVEAKFYRGLTQSKLGQYDDARFTFQNFALSYPDNSKAPEAWWNVAEAYAAQKNYREAAISFERIKVFHPKSKLAASGLLKASEYFDTVGDHASSEKMLRALLQDYAGSDVALPARLKLAERALTKNEFEAARAEAQRILASTKETEQRAQAQLLLTRAFLGLGKYQEGESTLNDILSNPRNSRYYDAQLLRGTLKKQLGKTQDAMTAWKLIAADSLRAPREIRQVALLELGESYAAVRNYASALPCFEQAGRIQGVRSGEALYKAAVASEKLKQPRKAGEYYARALRDSSGTVDRRALLIGAFKGAVQAENFAEALRLVSHYRTQFPQDRQTPRLLLEGARLAQQQLKDLHTAIENYQDVVTEYTSSPFADDALFGLGTSLAQSGEYERALQAFESLEKRFPGSDLVFRARDEGKRIRLFELKSRESGVEKLALLVGDVIAQKSRGDLAFRLAEIYFHELKDYEHAIQHYRLALNADLDPAKQPAAWYFLAKAHEYVAWKVGGEKKENEHSVVEAVATYDSLLTKFPLNEFRDDAVLGLFSLRLQTAATLSEIRTLHATFSKEYPTLGTHEALLLQIGNAYRRLGGNADALNVYRSMLQSRNHSEAAEALFQMAIAMNELGKADSSLGLLQSFVATYPQHARCAQAAWMLGQVAAEQSKAQQAIRAYELIEQRFPYTSYATQLTPARAHAYFQANDLPNAIEQYERALRELQEEYYTLPDVPNNLLYNLAQCYQRVGKNAEAKNFYSQYLVRDTSSQRAGEVYYALASIARKENNVELAARYLQEAGRFSTGSSEQRFRAALEVADLLFRGEVYNEAVARYAEVARGATSDSLQQYARARVAVSYFRMNNVEEAEKQVASFVKAYPRGRSYAAELEFERGRYLLRRDEFDKAKAMFENVIKSYADVPVAVDAQYWLGRVMEAVGRREEATKMYETIIERSPNHAVAPRARLSLGNLFYSGEQWDPAARQYKAILDNEQQVPDLVPYAMNNLILAYKELGLYDGALELTRKYIERFPTDPQLQNKRIDIGVLYQKLGYYDQSVLHLQSLLDGADSDTEAEVRYYIGESYFYKGDYQQAILEFLKVPYLVTRRTTIDWVATSFYMAGQSYEKMSRFDQAISMYKQIIERPNIDARFKAAAQKEINRVNALVKSQR